MLPANEGPFRTSEILEAELHCIRPGFPSIDPALDEAARRQEINAAVARLAPPLAALCLSGGGIRSASFALGIVQGLSRAGLLEQFDYLSTVSGGGYTGGWLIAWIHRAGGQLQPVVRELASETEPAPVAHLRAHCRYLRPRTRTEALRLALATVRNILLHWMLLLPVFLLPIAAPRIFLALILHPAGGSASHREGTVAAAGVAFGLGVWALAWSIAHAPSRSGQEPGRRAILYGCLLPGAVAILSLAIAYSRLTGDQRLAPRFFATLTMVAAVAACGVAAGLLIPRRRPRQSPASRMSEVWIGAAVAGPCIPAAALLTGVSSVFFPDPLQHPIRYALLAPGVIAAVVYLHALAFAGLASRRLSAVDRDWVFRLGRSTLALAAAWTGAGLVVFEITGAVLAAGLTGTIAIIGGGAAAAVLAVAGSVALRARAGIRALTWSSCALMAIVLLGLSVAFNVVAAGVAGMSWLDHAAVLEASTVGTIVAITLLAIAGTIVSGLEVDINEIGLGGAYRSALVRAFVGASSDPAPGSEPFTGFPTTQDIPVRDLSPAQRPFAVINMAANMVSAVSLDESENWQLVDRERSRQSFTVTALHAGNATVGYRPAGSFAGGLSLGTAIAVSGAAVTPLNLGYPGPSTPASFLLAALAVRLGRWVGNPGPAGSKTWRARSPRWALAPLANEAFALADARNAYLYLSDGGHVDNLGLYEMVARRCRVIVISDAGQDPEVLFEDLVRMLRRIRIDWGIPIELDAGPVHGRNRRWAIGRVGYSSADGPGVPDGLLLYLKAAIVGDEPPAVLAYAREQPMFPHHSTTDQWYDEVRFERYRALGCHTVESVLRAEVDAGWTLSERLQHLSAHASP
jgi:Patatin-like phospholipase